MELFFSKDRYVSRAHKSVDQRLAVVHGGLTAALPHELAGVRARGGSSG
jgi:hypothetical protein